LGGQWSLPSPTGGENRDELMTPAQTGIIMLGIKQILIVALGGAIGSVARYKLGGFTTFSAFGYESIFLLRRGLVSVAASYVFLSVLCGLAAVFVGMKLVDQFWPPHH
jgi:fluoride ion exporter CrcB/FEX